MGTRRTANGATGTTDTGDIDAAVETRSEFDALIRGQGRRFRIAVRSRAALCRLVHQPGWSHGALTVAYAFGAPAAAVSRRRR